MQIAAVAVSATDLSDAVAFYELLGFRFPPLEPGSQHVEAEAGVRLMIDTAALLTELHGEPPRPGNAAGVRAAVRQPRRGGRRRRAGRGGRAPGGAPAVRRAV